MVASKDMKGKQRLSASVDGSLLESGHEAVRQGRAENVSAWVNEALHRQVDHDRRMQALDALLAAYEAEHGEISDDEIREATRWARAGAVVVNGESRPSKPGGVPGST